MCPACIANVALIAVSATFTGGWATLIIARLHKTTGTKKIEPTIQNVGGQSEPVRIKE